VKAVSIVLRGANVPEHENGEGDEQAAEHDHAYHQRNVLSALEREDGGGQYANLDPGDISAIARHKIGARNFCGGVAL